MALKGTSTKEFIINKIKFKIQLKIMTSKYYSVIRTVLKFEINYKLVQKIIRNE